MITVLAVPCSPISKTACKKHAHSNYSQVTFKEKKKMDKKKWTNRGIHFLLFRITASISFDSWEFENQCFASVNKTYLCIQVNIFKFQTKLKHFFKQIFKEYLELVHLPFPVLQWSELRSLFWHCPHWEPGWSCTLGWCHMDKHIPQLWSSSAPNNLEEKAFAFKRWKKDAFKSSSKYIQLRSWGC